MYSYQKYVLSFLSAFVLFAKPFAASSQAPRFVQEEIIKVHGITTDGQIYGLTPSEKNTNRTYYDGFERPVQIIALKGSPSQKDVIQVKGYNNLGLQTTSYLPYQDGSAAGNYRSAAITGQAAFYNNGNGDKVSDDTMPYSQAVFENSPLRRLLVAGSVGNGFQPNQHGKIFGQRPNQSDDQIVRWSQGGNDEGFYAENSLWMVLSTDEDGHQSANFTDAEGKIVLKRTFVNELVNGSIENHFDTYYVYNEAGGLIWTVPPKAVSFMNRNPGTNLNTSEVKKLLFSYVYDEKGRIVEKNVPAASVIYTIYDPLNRPVLIQDGNLRGMGQWNYIKYDLRGRVISQGIYTDGVHITRVDMQNYVNGLDYSQNYYEKRSSDGSTGYYTNVVFPNTNLQDLAYSYFDNYDIDHNGINDYNYIIQGLNSEAQATSLTRGLLTMVRKRAIGGSLANTWLTSVQFYDKAGNIIQTVGNSQLNANVTNSNTIVPDFTGQVLRKKIVQYSSGGGTSVLTEYSYDHRGRLLAVNQQYNSDPMIKISGYEYNEIGQLVDRKLHSTNGGASWLQSIDYRYNISGRMTSINNSSLGINDKNDDGNDLFGMEIRYEQPEAALGSSGYYNGFISAVKWATYGNANQRAYRFEYDSDLRLKNAYFAQGPIGTDSWNNLSGYDEKNISYDQNGNILSLSRNALVNNAATPVDELNFNYDGNQLINLSDGNGGNYNQIGFKNLTGSTTGYSYTQSGNLTEDPKKGISLTYNILDKTDRITINTANGRYIDYSYDAMGKVLRKQVFDNNISVKITDYVEDFVYENGQLGYFAMPEGRVRNTGGGLKPEYMIKDYLGNVRVSFEEQNGVASLRQENSYYPFGLIMTGSNVATPTSANVNLYNAGSEWQNDFSDLPDYYSTFYRNYDPSIGRFVGVDPKAELMFSNTPYNYSGNNPIIFNDPLGDIRLSQDAQHLVDGVIQSSSGQSGTWTAANGFEAFSSDAAAFDFASGILGIDAFGQNGLFSYREAAARFNNDPEHTGGRVIDEWWQLRTVNIVEARADKNWLIKRQKEVLGIQSDVSAVQSKIDWRSLGEATLSFVGGAAEVGVAAAGEWFSGGLATPVAIGLAVDGSSRMALAFGKAVASLSGTTGRKIPGNLGGVIGLTIDNIAGTKKGMQIGGLVNDAFSVILTGGTSGTVTTLVSGATNAEKALALAAQLGVYYDVFNNGGVIK